MTDSYFDNLSDAEIRQELQKCGFPVIPVTETTRNLLIKKLKNHVLNDSSANKSVNNNRRSLQSSKNISKRPASPGRRSNASPSRRQTVASTYSNNSSKNINESSSTNVTSNGSRDFFLSSDGRPFLSRENFANDRNLSHQSLGDNIYSHSPSNLQYVKRSTPNNSPKIYVPPPILSSDINFNSSLIDSSRASRESVRTSLRNGKETPGVVSRLLKLRDITIGRSQMNTSYAPSTPKYFYISDSDSDNGSPTRCNSTFNRRNSPSILNNVWAHLDIRKKFKQSSVPYLLISCLGLFFLILAVLYMTKPPDMPSTMLEKSTTFTLCEEVNGQTLAVPKSSVNCINNELLGTALALNKELIQLLQKNTETHYCKDRSVSPEITGTEFMKYLYKKRTMDAHKLLKGFHAAIYLIKHNPQWKIKILSSSEDQQQQLPDIYKQDIQFGLLKPYLPLKCILYNKLQRFFVIIGTVFLIAVLVGLAFVLWRFWNQKRIWRLKIVDNFTKDIVKELMQRASYKDGSQGELIINHLRDKLIPLNKRKSLLWAWNEALQKLESSDSRIQFGCILKNGEEFRTMKWVETSLVVPSNLTVSSSFSLTNNSYHDNSEQRLKKKHWQSPAFDNVNKINDPPTPCLKIRHMFDASEANLPDLKQNIIESILEKVGPHCRIYDIQLDRQSCCVYIRCASEKDAGIIHNEINGWWFDNRLVSIKFLRLQRYLVRFPNSTSIVPITIKNYK